MVTERKLITELTVVTMASWFALVGVATESAANTVLLDQFERQGMLNGSAPTIGNETWIDIGDDAVTTGSQAFIAVAGENSRANYPVQLADGLLHTYTIDIDVVDGGGLMWGAMGFAWTIESDSTTTGTGPWMAVRSENSPVDIETFTLAGSGRRMFNFGEGPLAGLDFTNAGRLTMQIDARQQTDTVQYFFNDRPLTDPIGLVPNGVSNIKGVFIAGLTNTFYDNAQLVSVVPEPSGVMLAILGLWELAQAARRRSLAAQ